MIVEQRLGRGRLGRRSSMGEKTKKPKGVSVIPSTIKIHFKKGNPKYIFKTSKNVC